MKSVVITGSTRGIGYGLAEEFLKRGHQVAVCGRDAENTAKAVDSLSKRGLPQHILGQACDVGDYSQVQQLWEATVTRFGKVDIWINNAALNSSRLPLWEQPLERIDKIVYTNVLGLMYGSKIAMQGMLKQGYGQIYNMEGLGSDGKPTPGLILYGCTKSALTYYTKGLIEEARHTPVQVGLLSPGMVVTDMLTGTLEGARDVARSKRIFNILADNVETVAPYLVEQILANQQHGARIAWLTKPKALWRFLTARFNQRELFPNS
jgi:NAD(P)-dependent dehydrogenase (short-subunit alcohol dehydrogenase family)